MRISKKLCVIAALAILIFSGIAATAPPADPTYKNLKVLPKNTSHETLDKVMREFNEALGVKCNFCHAPRADDPKKLDFASDEKEHKKIARDMMKLTIKINKKYFSVKKPVLADSTLEVSCITCHNGSPHPKKPGKQEAH